MALRSLLIPACCMLALCLASCPQRDSGTQSKSTAQPQADTGSVIDPGVDHLADALLSDDINSRNFAMLTITNFGLKGYELQLTPLAIDDPVAAVTIAAVYGNIQPALDFYNAQPAETRVDSIIGSVFGLGCSSRMPAEFWTELLAQATAEDLDSLLWGMAQLDIEPGGPLVRSAGLTVALSDRFTTVLAGSDTYLLGALDAMLGTTDERSIDWQRYLDFAAESPWNAIQWSALLRWADADVWHALTINTDLNERIRYQLARAVAFHAPADVALPGGLGPWAGIDADVEYRVNQFVIGKTALIELPELDVLLAATAVAGDGEAPAINQRAYGDLLALIDYALVRREPGVIASTLTALPDLPDEIRNGVVATIMRRRPEALTDGQLEQIIDSGNRSLAYFLLTGWYDRRIVRESATASLVRVTAGYENTLAYYGYQRWLEQQGLAE